jgi:hypothetical protein
MKAWTAGLAAQFDRATLLITKTPDDGTSSTFSLSDSSDDALGVIFGGDSPPPKEGIDTEIP